MKELSTRPVGERRLSRDHGFERLAVVAVHPLTGYRTAEPFALERGRMCVTLSRHRARLTLLADTATAPLLTTTASSDPDAAEALSVRRAFRSFRPWNHTNRCRLDDN